MSLDEVIQTERFQASSSKSQVGRAPLSRPLLKGSGFKCARRSNHQPIPKRSQVSGVGQTSISKHAISNIRPERATRILERLSTRYIEYSTAARKEINAKTDEFIELQLLKIEANVDSLQDIIDQQRQEAEVLDLSRNEQAYFQELIQLETQQEELRLSLRSLSALEGYLARGVENTSIPPSTFLTSDAVASGAGRTTL